MSQNNITVGYLHIGGLENGVCLYGYRLANEAKKRSNLTVLEKEIVLSGIRHRDVEFIIEAAKYLSKAQVVHIQFTEKIWGSDKNRFNNLNNFVSACTARIVATIHDTESIRGFCLSEHSSIFGTILNRIWQFARLIWLQYKFFLNQIGVAYAFFPSNAWIRQWLIRHVDLSFVCTEEEKHRLHLIANSDKIIVVPHYVEERSSLPDRNDSRRALGLENFKVITLLGFIFGGKGHSLLLRALSLLPDKNILIVFVGGIANGSERIFEKLVGLAKRLNVSDRLRITGYLSEQELEKYLVATDIAVCPYSICYASGSLATWISVSRHILASNLPQFRKYNDFSPNAIRIFSPHTPESLAESLLTMLSSPLPIVNPSVVRLRDFFSIRVIFDVHFNYYKNFEYI